MEYVDPRTLSPRTPRPSRLEDPYRDYGLRLYQRSSSSLSFLFEEKYVLGRPSLRNVETRTSWPVLLFNVFQRISDCYWLTPWEPVPCSRRRSHRRSPTSWREDPLYSPRESKYLIPGFWVNLTERKPTEAPFTREHVYRSPAQSRVYW